MNKEKRNDTREIIKVNVKEMKTNILKKRKQ